MPPPSSTVLSRRPASTSPRSAEWSATCTTAILLPSNEYLFLTDEAVILLDAAGWGWWHLIIGAAMVLVGVVLVSINAISQMGLLAVQPLWSLIMILLDIIVIYALIVHGREMKRT